MKLRSTDKLQKSKSENKEIFIKQKWINIKIMKLINYDL